MPEQRILVGDVRERLKDLDDASVQCVVTSPPYFNLRNYGVDGQIGLEATLEDYLETLVDVFRDVRRVLRPDGVAFINMGDSYANDTKWGGSTGGKHVASLYGESGIGRQKVNTGLKAKDLMMVPARLAIALQADGWWLRSDIIWAKSNPMPESVQDRPTSSHEHIFLLTKSARYFYDADAVRTESSMPMLNNGYTPEGQSPHTGGQKRFNGKHSDKQRGHSRRHDGFNDRWDSMSKDEQQSMGANLRNVWPIATHAFPGAHFATFPPEIPRRCIKAGTSEHGCCSSCGAPWKRTTEMTSRTSTRPGSPIKNAASRNDDEWRKHRFVSVYETIGWEPSCKCDADVTPCTVLDPFLGSGTTLMVADQIGRNGVGIELNPTYADMARKRISDDAPMFANVSVSPQEQLSFVDVA